jgi:hypothetical protein
MMKGAILSRIPASALLLLSVTLGGCVTTRRMPPTVPNGVLPAVAAQYRTTVTRDGQSTVSNWRYWRSDDRVQREDLGERTGDLWQRDGATMFHTLLFHEDRRGIEFEQVDVQMTGGNTSWDQQAQIVGPDLLAKLQLVKSGWRGDVPWRDYAGRIGAVHWQVRMRADMMLPIRVEQRAAHDTLRIELVEVHDLTHVPWHPTSSDGYGMVDFADLGDHERDPFVVRVQAHLGLDHDHAH